MVFSKVEQNKGQNLLGAMVPMVPMLGPARTLLVPGLSSPDIQKHLIRRIRWSLAEEGGVFPITAFTLV